MRKYEIYTIEKNGTLKPTGIWDRGTKMSHVEDSLGRVIKKLDVPCVIGISNLTPEDTESPV